MPQRFLRPGIRTSDAWNSVSWQAQSLYIRLLTLVDDWGRYDGRLLILHGECFALRADVSTRDTAGFRDELHNVGLIVLYLVDGKEFIQVSRWTERARSDHSRYPDPVSPQDSAGIRRNPQGNEHACVETASTTSPSPPPLPEARASASTATGPLAELSAAWNAAGYAKIVKMSEGRARVAKARLTDAWWRENYPAGIERLRGSSFCQGHNDRSWRADFDWFIKPDTLAKIMEGKYDDKAKAAVNPVTGRPMRGGA